MTDHGARENPANDYESVSVLPYLSSEHVLPRNCRDRETASLAKLVFATTGLTRTVLTSAGPFSSGTACYRGQSIALQPTAAVRRGAVSSQPDARRQSLSCRSPCWSWRQTGWFRPYASSVPGPAVSDGR